jgi:hypothetical protein
MGLGKKLRSDMELARIANTSTDDHYDAEVNRGYISMKTINAKLNTRHKEGWKLAHLLEQGGNTAFVWERSPVAEWERAYAKAANPSEIETTE